MTVELSIIIVNWKCAGFTRSCLSSIERTARGLCHEVIVIDNASYDGCAEMIAAEFPRVTFIQSHRNLGFAGANNAAFERSCGRNILFLNPDTELADGALEHLLGALRSLPQAGMVGAKLLNSDGSLQTTCVTAVPSIANQTLSSDHLRRLFPKWRIWGMYPLFVEPPAISPVEAISGACMMAKREVIEKVGGFTKAYFMYAEDMDLCVKVVKAGWKIYYVPTATITHHAAKSSASREERNFSSIMIHESVLRFMQVHRGRFYASLYKSSTGVVAIARLLLLIVTSPLAVVHRKGRRFLSRAMSKWTDLLFWALLGTSRWPVQQSRTRLRSLAQTSMTTEKG